MSLKKWEKHLLGLHRTKCGLGMAKSQRSKRRLISVRMQSSKTCGPLFGLISNLMMILPAMTGPKLWTMAQSVATGFKSQQFSPGKKCSWIALLYDTLLGSVTTRANREIERIRYVICNNEQNFLDQHHPSYTYISCLMLLAICFKKLHAGEWWHSQKCLVSETLSSQIHKIVS